MSSPMQLSNSFPTPKALVLFLLDESSYVVVDLESSYWPHYFGLEENKAPNCGDVFQQFFQGVSENCPVFSQGSKAACVQAARCQKLKRSRDSNPTSTETTSKMPKAEVCNHPGKNVSESIVGVLETPVSEVKNFRLDMRKVRLLIEGYDRRPSQVSCTGTQLQPVKSQDENLLQVTASNASKNARRVADKFFTVKEQKRQLSEPEKRKGLSAEILR